MDEDSDSESVPAKQPRQDLCNGKEYLCGVGNYRPGWMQRFATSRYYAVAFGALGVFQGAYRTYLVATLSTFEKRFSMSSRRSSIITIADDIGPILATFVLILCVRRASKPNVVAVGMLLSFLGALASALPYSVYGKGTHLMGTTGSSGTGLQIQFCGGSNIDATQCSGKREFHGAMLPFAFLFAGNFLNGLGGTAYYVIGTTYMDDNVKKTYSALYFGFAYAFRLMGPLFGFFIASLCLSFPEDPLDEPGLDIRDPRWIGAWWVGYLVIAMGIFVCVLPMFFFPKKIRPNAEANKTGSTEREDTSFKAEVKGAMCALHRLSRNPICVFKTLGNVTAFIALAGYSFSFPKYTEHQFSLSASRASLFGGPTYILSNVIGAILGSFFVHKVRPRPRIIASHQVLVIVVAVAGILGLMSIRCGSVQYPLTHDSEERLTIQNQCNAECICSTSVRQPVCDLSTGTQYFSACFAGCGSQPLNQTDLLDCQCLQSEPGRPKFSHGDVKNGKCEQDCLGTMMTFSGVVFFIQVVLSTSHVGSTLLLLRAIEPQDKTIALTITSFIMNIFAFIPYPLIFGAIIDACCIVWEDHCGHRGACWVYNLKKLRYLIHGVSALLLVISCIFHGAVVYYSNRIEHFYDESCTAEESLRGSPNVSGLALKEVRRPKKHRNRAGRWEVRSLTR
ncbi:solute carrier organic anion transporter family member 74D isoform X1 [Ixodes scapularis]